VTYRLNVKVCCHYGAAGPLSFTLEVGCYLLYCRLAAMFCDRGWLLSFAIFGSLSFVIFGR